ncbi:MAG: hypothetical protein AAF363_21760 [Bacteroidota bacterium]
MAKHALLSALDLNSQMFKLVIKDISNGESLQSPGNNMNSINWICGHITYMRTKMFRQLNKPFELDKAYESYYASGTHPSPSKSEDLEDIVELYHSSSKELSEELQSSISAGNLSEEAASAINNYLIHEAYHIGQVGLLRRYLGKEGAR